MSLSDPANIAHKTDHGSPFSGLTKFPDLSLTFPVFFPFCQYSFNVLLFFKLKT